jgi:hypothetical protein
MCLPPNVACVEEEAKREGEKRRGEERRASSLVIPSIDLCPNPST